MSEGHMTISVEQIKKLIEDYRGYERECIKGEYNPVAFGRAALYRTVIMDLERLLPRKSMTDIPPEEWPDHVGTWVEYEGEMKVVYAIERSFWPPIAVFDPKTGECEMIVPGEAFLTDNTAAWDSEGNPA